MKRKRKIYLDTSVISHLDATDVPDKMADTWRLWYRLEKGFDFEVVISPVVQKEIFQCYESKRSQMVVWLDSIDHQELPETEDVLDMAEEFINFGILSPKHFDDVLHIAYAVSAGCDCVVSWNFKHFVNVTTLDKVNAVNLVNGYPPIKIVSPTMLIEGDSHE